MKRLTSGPVAATLALALVMPVLMRASSPVAAAAASQAPAAQAPPTPVDPARVESAKRAVAVVEALVAQDFAKVRGQFSAVMKTQLAEEQLKETWSKLLSQTGPFKRQLGAAAGNQGPVELVIVRCEFEKALIDIQIASTASGEITGLSIRPAQLPVAEYTMPSYAVPAKYTEVDVTVGGGEWALPGTLTLPVGTGKVPAVVLVHGSGPNDRDETSGAVRPFKDLALGLASRGIAVLRYEKRTRQYTAKMAVLRGLTVKDEVIDDALAAVAVLRGQPRVDATKIFVLGHSLGGFLIPRIAAGDARVAGYIVMAGNTRPITQAALDQMRYLANYDGTIAPAEQAQIDGAIKLKQQVEALTAQDAATKTELLAGAPASYWVDLKAYAPTTAAKGITKPMLFLQGERDYQVTMTDDFATWKTALSAKRNATFKSYPGLNHLFVMGTAKSSPQEYMQPGHVAEDVIRDIAAWIAPPK